MQVNNLLQYFFFNRLLWHGLTSLKISRLKTVFTKININDKGFQELKEQQRKTKMTSLF